MQLNEPDKSEQERALAEAKVILLALQISDRVNLMARALEGLAVDEEARRLLSFALETVMTGAALAVSVATDADPDFERLDEAIRRSTEPRRVLRHYMRQILLHACAYAAEDGFRVDELVYGVEVPCD